MRTRLALSWMVAVAAVIAAAATDVTGKWNVTAVTESGREMKLELLLSGDAENLKGTLGNEEGTVDLQEIKLAGSNLSFKVSTGEATYQVKLAVDGDTMKGAYSSEGGGSGKVSAARAK